MTQSILSKKESDFPGLRVEVFQLWKNLSIAFCLSLASFSTCYSQALKMGLASMVEPGFGAEPNLSAANVSFFSGNFLYVAGSDQLEIFDVTFPAYPIHKGLLKNGDGGAIITDARSIFVAGSFAYIALHTGQVEIVDVSDPANPKHKGKISNGEGGAALIYANGITVSGNYAYVASLGSHMLEIIDVSNPAAPKHTSKLSVSNASHVAVAAFNNVNYAFVTSDNSLLVINIQNPSLPSKVKTIIHSSIANPQNVTLAGNNAFVASIGGYLTKINIKDPLNPVVKASLANANNTVPPTATPYLNKPRSVIVSGNYVYASGDYGTLEVADTATLTHQGGLYEPVLASKLFDFNQQISKQGNYIYFPGGANSKLAIIDASNPLAPVTSSVLSTGDGAKLAHPRQVYVSNKFAYVADEYENFLEIINVSEPTVPEHAASLPIAYNGKGPRSLFVLGNYVYLATTNSLEIVDVSNPNFPVWVSRAAHGGSFTLNDARSVAVTTIGSNTYALLASFSSNSIEVIDVTNPQSPTFKARLTDGGGTAPFLKQPSHIYIEGTNAYVISQNGVGVNSTKAGTISVTKGSSTVTGTGTMFTSDATIGSSIANSGGYLQPTYVKIGTVASVTSNTSLTLSAPSPFNYSSGSYYNTTNPNAGALQIIDLAALPTGSPTVKGFLKGIGSYINPLSGTMDQGASSFGITGGNNIYVRKVGTNTYAYIADNYNKALAIVDVTISTAPTLKSSITSPIKTQGSETTTGALSGTRGVALFSNYALLPYFDLDGISGDFPQGVTAIDVSDPALPTHVGTFNSGQDNSLIDSPTSIFISGQYAYVSADGYSFKTLCILDLYAPSVVSGAGGYSPSNGPAGSSVTINGTNFNTFLTASINGLNAPITNITATSITLTIPQNASIGPIILTSTKEVARTSANFIVTPTALAPTSIAQTSFVANWSNVGAVKYFLDVSTDGFTTFVSGYNGISVGNVTSYAVSGLSPGKTYQYRIRSSDGVNNSGNSNSINTTTLPVTPLAKEATFLTQSGFTINWTAVAGADSYTVDVAYDNAFSNFVVGYNNLIVPNATATSQVVTGLNPYTKCYYRVRSASLSGSSSSSNVITVTTLDPVPPTISSSGASNPAKITLGNTPVLNVNVTDNVSVATVNLFYRGISETSFKNVTMQGPGGTGENYSITLQTDWYDSIGLEYYFKGIDQAGNTSVNASSFIQLVTPSLSLPSLPSGTEQSDYRIVAFPYQLVTDNKITTVYNNVPWNDNTKAGLWWWNPNLKNGSGEYDQYTTNGNLQTIEPGKGYWVITNTLVTPQLTNVPSPNYNKDKLFQMNLKPGWNQIGNPYPVAISWDDVVEYNQKNNITSFSALNLYDGSGYKTATGNVLLKPFEGGFVKNLSSSDITIQIPFKGQISAGGRTTSISSDISQGDWNIFLHIQQNEYTNQLGGFGMHRLAQSGVDRYDNFNPPSFLGIPQVNFTNDEYPDATFSNDMVKSQDNYIWTFTPEGSVGKMAMLEWDTPIITSSKQLLLLDEEQLRVIDMSSVTQYDFVLTNNSRFRIFYGSDVKVTTSCIIASSPYPNPLNNEGRTNISLALPESGSDYAVNMQIYNGQGSVIGSMNKRFMPGIHPLEFTLPDSLSEGIYIYKLAVNNDKISSIHTGKIVKR